MPIRVRRPRRGALLVAALAALLVAPPGRGRAQSAAPLDTVAIDSAVRDEMRATRTPGVAIAVVRGDRVAYARGYGVRSAESTEPVDDATLFRIGSVTKTVTGLTASLLVARGQLDVDAPIRRYAPELRAPIRDLTMRRLLSHTAGLIQEGAATGSHDDSALARRVLPWDARETFAPPGDVYSYSSPGYWLAGYIVERIARAPYADVVEREVLAPLGMRRSTFRPLVAMTYPLALDHRVDSAGAHVLRPFADDASTWPSGSLFASAEELGRLAAAIMNGGRVEGVQRLPAAAIAPLDVAQADVPGDDGERCAYTFGLSRCDEHGVHTLTHYGFRAGSGAVFALRPDDRVAVIVLANRSGAIFARTAARVFDIVLGARAATPRASDPRPAGDAHALVGTYINGLDTLRVTLRADTLRYAYNGNPAQRARAASGGALEVLDARGEVEQRFTIVRGTSGATYLHDGLDAFRRMPR